MSSDHDDARRQERPARAQERRDPAAERRERGRARGRARHWLNTDAIVETALRIADEDGLDGGLDAPHRRRTCAWERCRSTTTWAHKDELVELMADAISAELLVPGEILGDWRAALRAIAQRTRATRSCATRGCIDTAGRRPLVTPNQLRHIEQSIAIVADLDVDRDTAIGMVMAVDDYTIGYVFRRLAFGGGDRPAATDADRARVLELLDTASSRGSPRSTATEADLAPPGDTFERGPRVALRRNAGGAGRPTRVGSPRA